MESSEVKGGDIQLINLIGNLLQQIHTETFKSCVASWGWVTRGSLNKGQCHHNEELHRPCFYLSKHDKGLLNPGEDL